MRGKTTATSPGTLVRVTFAVTALLFSCLLTTGCTPRPIPMAAVFLDGGHPTAIFHTCRGSVDLLDLWEDLAAIGEIAPRLAGAATASDATATSPADASSTVSRWWSIVDSDAHHHVAQVRLLQTPPGWYVEGIPGRALITTFREDATYTLNVSTTRPSAGTDSLLRFTLRQLRSVPDGLVWAAPRAFGQPRAMTREEYHRRVKRLC